jgi:hypothetical protein
MRITCVFTTEVVDGEGDKEAADMTMVHIQTLLKALSDMSLTACFTEKQNFQSWGHSS